MQSERLRLFLELEESKYFQKVNSVYVKNKQFENLWDCESLHPLSDMLVEYASELRNNRIFVHPCPVDEATNLGYSFAGVYRSYKPYRCLNIRENIEKAVWQLKNNGFSFYANFYYQKNELNDSRKVDLFVSCENEDICGYGTGYIDSEKCLMQYFDSPLSIYRNEPKRIYGKIKDIVSGNVQLHRKLVLALCSVQEQIDDIIDIEFVFDRKLNVFINEVRKLSNSHVANWIKTDESLTWTYGSAASCILNTVGEIEKRVRIWRYQEFNFDEFDLENDVLYVRYESDEQLFEMQKQFADFKRISLIISYPFHIIDNHYSYVLNEYDTFGFILRCTRQLFFEGQIIKIKSNGLTYSIEEKV